MSVSVSPPFALSSSPPFSTTGTTRRTSPPRTPIEHAQSRSSSATPSDDSSIIDDLSFDYIFDDEGNYVRLSKGSSSKSNSSSPPTPQDLHPREPDPPPYPPSATSSNGNLLHPKPPSPILLNSPVRRGSLSRSESAYPVLNGPSTASSERVQALSTAARSFQRVASGPASMTPASTSTLSNGTSLKPRTLPRRVTMEDSRDQEARNRKQVEEYRARMDEEMRAQQDEKENILGIRPDSGLSAEDPYILAVVSKAPSAKRHSPPLTSRSVSATSASSRAILPSRTGYPSATRPLADVPVPQRGPHARQVLPGPNRPGRIMKGGSKYGASAVATGFGRISEVEGSEGESGAEYNYGAGYTGGEETDTGGDDDPIDPVPSSAPANMNSTARQRSYAGLPSIATTLGQSGNTRPRRSASLSDASTQEDYLQQHPPQHQPHEHQNQSHHQQSRPGTSLGLNHTGSNLNGDGPRRVTVEERDRQEMEMRVEYKKYRREAEEAERRAQADAQQQELARQSPSPTHSNAHAHLHRPSYAHKRRDSDTLRSVAHPTTQSGSGSPTAVELPPRLSPSTRSLPPSSSAKHRRSPTAPEPPTTSGMLGPAGGQAGLGKTWAAGDREDEYGDREKERERASKSAPIPQQHVQAPPPVPAPAPVAQLNRQMVVNKKAYARLDMIGKGGSSRVYRVMNHANELYAIKRVSLDKTDSETMSGYMNEIALLKRLDGNGRIIRLIDSEVKAGPGGSKGHLLLVMECGEIDLARLLTEQQKEPMNMVWISYYWQQMLQAVHVIHEEKIVHSDLKPANFVLVRGQLKLIDFGIANAIANDTTNIQRDHQIGTVNYMSPEAIELPDGMRRLKVGRPSDVWSLGCILYQMVYGQPPFQHLSVYQKMKAIPDLTHVIDFPEYSTPSIPASRSQSQPQGSTTPPKKLDHLKRRVRRDVIASMKSCLGRNPKERSTIPELLEQDWLAMKEAEPPAVKDLLAPDETVINPYYMRQLLQYGIKLGETQNTDMGPEALLREAERLVAELKAIQP